MTFNATINVAVQVRLVRHDQRRRGDVMSSDAARAMYPDLAAKEPQSARVDKSAQPGWGKGNDELTRALYDPPREVWLDLSKHTRALKRR